MSERALTFGSVASAYERFRPGYPDAVVDEVLTYAVRPIRTALEIGAGTGKATRAFASRDIAVTATDPDQAMLTELRKHVPSTVVTLRAALEELPATGGYDLVFAAASLHWTQPVNRWPRIAGMLAQDGTFASFGGQLELADSEVERAVQIARTAFLSTEDLCLPGSTPAAGSLQWPGPELIGCKLFTDVRQSRIERRAELSALEYVGHLSTISAYLQLPQPERDEVLARILDVLPDRVAVISDVTVHLARRSG